MGDTGALTSAADVDASGVDAGASGPVGVEMGVPEVYEMVVWSKDPCECAEIGKIGETRTVGVSGRGTEAACARCALASATESRGLRWERSAWPRG